MSFIPFINWPDFKAADPGWNTLGNVVGFTQNGNVFALHFSSGPDLQLSFLTPTIFRVRFNATGTYLNNDFSYAVDVARLPAMSSAALTVTDDGTNLIIDTGQVVVQIQKQPYNLKVLRTGQVISEDAPRNVTYVLESVANFKKIQPYASYYGCGEKAGLTLDKKGRGMTFFNFDNFSCPIDDGQAMYASIPFLIEANPLAAPAYCYGLFLDNPSQTYMNIGKVGPQFSDEFYVGALFGELNYYFIYGDQVKDVVEQYTSLTGRMPMPPKYTLGYHQGCYGYSTANLLLAAAQAYRNAAIPCDGLHIDIDFQDNYCTFTTSQTNFPNAPAMMNKLHQMGFKCSTNITAMINSNPGRSYQALQQGLVQNVFLSDPDSPQNHYVGTENYGTNTRVASNPPLSASGFYPDFTKSGVPDWWGAQYAYLIETVGLDMIWQDMMCPAIAIDQAGRNPNKTFPLNVTQYDFGRNQPHGKIHNVYGLTILKASFEGVTRLKRNLKQQGVALRQAERNFIIARGGYAGLQKYAGLWTGDSSSLWTDYQRNIPMVLNLGLSGVPIAGSDIGGFANGDVNIGDHVSEELLTRWTTMGAFLPWFRNHYDGYTKDFQEPFRYSATCQNICRKYIELRYRLLQYLYDCLHAASVSGTPIARPLFFNFPEDLNAYDFADTEFFVGDAILVAPVLAVRGVGRTVYLPTEGGAAPTQWYAYSFSGRLDAPILGGTPFLVSAPLDTVPVYVRAGAIIPMRELEQWVGEKSAAPLTFDIYPGPDNDYALYLDDGESLDYQQGQYRETTIHTITIAQNNQLKVTVDVTRSHDNYTPPEPFFYVRLLGKTVVPTQVTLNGGPLVATVDLPTLEGANTDGFFYDQIQEVLLVKVFDANAALTVAATF